MALALATGAACAQPEPGPLRFLIPGEYHGGEAPHTLGAGWLALVPSASGWRLVPAQARSERVFDSVLDAEGQATGVRIAAQSDVVALLRLPGLRPGPVSTPGAPWQGSLQALSATGPISIPFKGSRYRLEVRGTQAHLRNANRSTPLAGLVVAGPQGEDSAALLWAGDLDGDDRLDLLVSYSGYNHGGVCLYLSSHAPGAALVRRVACHGGVGC